MRKYDQRTRQAKDRADELFYIGIFDRVMLRLSRIMETYGGHNLVQALWKDDPEEGPTPIDRGSPWNRWAEWRHLPNDSDFKSDVELAAQSALSSRQYGAFLACVDHGKTGLLTNDIKVKVGRSLDDRHISPLLLYFSRRRVFVAA